MLEIPQAILYGQVQVFRAGLSNPGSMWSDEHVAQGFAWRPGTVSFGVPDHDGECLLRARVIDGPFRLDDGALWAVAVPFRSTGAVEVGGILSTHTLEVPAGAYRLAFQALPGSGGHAFILDVVLSPDADAGFEILRVGGGGVTVDRVLRRDALQA